MDVTSEFAALSYEKTLLTDFLTYNILFLKFLWKDFVMVLSYFHLTNTTTFLLILYVTFRRHAVFSDFLIQ